MPKRRRSGQIKQLGPDRFKCIIFVGAVQGHNKYKSKTVTGTYRQAQDALTKMLADREAYSPHAMARRPLSAYVEHYLKKLEDTKRVRANTLVTMTNAFKVSVLPTLGSKKLESIKATHIQAWLNTLAAELAPATLRLRYSYLKTMFSEAVADGVLAKSPCPDRVALPGKTKSEIKALSTEQLRTLLEGATEGQARAMLTLLASTGMRPSEARALAWHDLDTVTGVLTVSKSVDTRGNVTATKTNRVRRVTLPGTALRELASLPRESALIFHNDFGKHLSHKQVSHIFKNAADHAGIAGFSLYALRHTHVSQLLSAGENITVVSQRVGHANPTMTLNVYSHLLPGLEAQAAQRWEALFAQERITN